jgi:hypothetical protein
MISREIATALINDAVRRNPNVMAVWGETTVDVTMILAKGDAEPSFIADELVRRGLGAPLDTLEERVAKELRTLWLLNLARSRWEGGPWVLCGKAAGYAPTPRGWESVQT